MTITDTLTDSELDSLAVWVDARYVKGFLVREDDGTLRPIKMIEGYASRHRKSKRRIRALELIKRHGCCGSSSECYPVHVDDPDNFDPATNRRTVIYCGLTDEPCPRAQIQNIVQLFSILNSEHIYEHGNNDTPKNIAYHG